MKLSKFENIHKWKNIKLEKKCYAALFNFTQVKFYTFNLLLLLLQFLFIFLGLQRLP